MFPSCFDIELHIPVDNKDLEIIYSTFQQSMTQTSESKAPPLPTSAPPSKPDNSLGADRLGSDIEEDPFFDDIPAPSQQFSTLSK